MRTQVRVSYEETPTRLHAKAWLFHRLSGLSTAYIGSFNLSRAALTEGLEWNLRVAGAELPQIVDKFEEVFRRYWKDPDAFTGTTVKYGCCGLPLASAVPRRRLALLSGSAGAVSPFCTVNFRLAKDGGFTPAKYATSPKSRLGDGCTAMSGPPPVTCTRSCPLG
jgi:phosphatidylserine/phosphatidylglycerophosphate/cardiolipin synthase-like enzyme